MNNFKFKVGDKVQIRKDSKHYGDEGYNPKDTVGTVTYAGERRSEYPYKVKWPEGKGTNVYRGKDLELAATEYPNPPHKHRDLIIAWANGAEIEFRSNPKNPWIPRDIPMWADSSEYRIKPAKSEAELELEKLEKQAEELQNQIKKIKESIK